MWLTKNLKEQLSKKENMNRFAKRRKKLGFSQNTLSNVLGVTGNTLARWERGDGEPGDDVFNKILNILVQWQFWYARISPWILLLWTSRELEQEEKNNGGKHSEEYFSEIRYKPVKSKIGNRVLCCEVVLNASFDSLCLTSLSSDNVILGKELDGERGKIIEFGTHYSDSLNRGDMIEFFLFFDV